MSQLTQVLASAARTATPASVVLDVPPDARNLLLLIDVTAVTLTPSITATISGQHPENETEYAILSGTALTAISTQQLIVGPDIADVANVSEQTVLPPRVVIDVAHLDADSITYGVYAQFR